MFANLAKNVRKTSSMLLATSLIGQTAVAAEVDDMISNATIEAYHCNELFARGDAKANACLENWMELDSRITEILGRGLEPVVETNNQELFIASQAQQTTHQVQPTCELLHWVRNNHSLPIVDVQAKSERVISHGFANKADGRTQEFDTDNFIAGATFVCVAIAVSILSCAFVR